MARVQLIIPDKDRDRFVHQARKEGMTFSAWLRAAARDRLEGGRARNGSNPETTLSCSSRSVTHGEVPAWNQTGRSISAQSKNRAYVVCPAYDLRRYERLHVRGWETASSQIPRP